MLFFVSEHLSDEGTNHYLVSAADSLEVSQMFAANANLEITSVIEGMLNEQYGGFAALGTV